MVMVLLLLGSVVYPQTVQQALQELKTIKTENTDPLVCQKLVADLQEAYSHLKASQGLAAESRSLSFHVGTDAFEMEDLPEDSAWCIVRILPQHQMQIGVSDSLYLYGWTHYVLKELKGRSIEELNGRVFHPAFQALEGSDSFFAQRLRFSKEFVPAESIKEFARIGVTHVKVNALHTPDAYEQGPPGEHYYRFYVTDPDWDQFVESDFNHGIYPPQYLTANLQQLQHNAALTTRWGVSPGLSLCSPRSVPESLLRRYPHLRGARVDHPFHSYKPRYTLTLKHPAVQWHYKTLVQKVLKAVPQLSYAYIWSNDSGSGFEHTHTLYPGRNGGAFLVREWRTHEQIASKAAENVLNYYTLVQNAADSIHPGFLVTSRLLSFPYAKQEILAGMTDNMGVTVSPADSLDDEWWHALNNAKNRGVQWLGQANLGTPYSHIPGIPFPRLTRQRLESLSDMGYQRAKITVHPASLSPFDINREVLRHYQFNTLLSIETVLDMTAETWAGKDASTLKTIWSTIDEIVQSVPSVPLYQGYGFVSFRLWVRPLVPDYDRIPREQRAYYEETMLTNYYNPNLVDLGKNALWTIISQAEADSLLQIWPDGFWSRLDDAINTSRQAASRSERPVFTDLTPRLMALKCYYKTLYNTVGWIAHTHAFLDTEDPAERNARQKQLRALIEDEIENSRTLLELWESSSEPFMPVSTVGERWYSYGENFPELLKTRIHLMKTHLNDTPHIDPDYMWRLSPDGTLDSCDYLDP
jgi:hypothetical protein